MTVDDVCREIMADTSLPMARRVSLVREIRGRGKKEENARNIIKDLAGIYMGYAWAKANKTNRLVGSYLGHLLSQKL